jgi:hypothetical protein
MYAFLALGGLCALSIRKDAQAQTLYLDPPRQHIVNRPFNGAETLTLSLMVDFGIEDAVAWGTDITLADTSTLEFVPDFGGPGKPFKSTQPFFDTDFSDYSDADSGDGDAILHLNFLNFADPSATFGQAGQVMLGQFQVKVKQEPGYPGDPNFGGAILLSDLGSPPFGSAVEDMDGNNLLISVGDAAITSRPSTPEPSSWITMLFGTGLGALLLRRRAGIQTAFGKETHS